MPAIITTKCRINNTQQFIEGFSEAVATNYYLFIGKVTAWDDDNAPPTPTDSVQNQSYDHWRDMIAAKKIISTDVSHVIPRSNWTSNTVYTEYTDTNTTLFSNTFFVLNSTNDVYKCLFNNAEANSTVQPTGTGTSIITTADGYQWKYMYTINSVDGLKWLTENYMPVKRIGAVDDGSNQWDVEQAAVDGAINIIDVTANGSGYTSTHTNTVNSVINSTAITLKSSTSASDDLYNGSVIHFSSGTGSGQAFEVSDYTGATRTLVVNTAFTTTPDVTTTYFINPKVAITGDGTGALAVSNTTAGAVSTVTIITPGSAYTNAVVAISAGAGTGATATAYIGPPGGHGYDAVEELGAYYVMMNTRLEYGESNNFTVDNDYRKIGIMKDPLYANGDIATATLVDQAVTLSVSSVSGTFTSDEVVELNANTTITGKLIDANSSIIRLTDVYGTFVTGTANGQTSSASATIDAVSGGDFLKYSGDLMYIEQRKPITRASDQVEDLKIIFQY